MNNDLKIRSLHPLRLMMYFLFASLSMLFLVLCVAYLFSKGSWTWTEFKFPRSFILSTFFLFGGSWTMQKALVFFEQENIPELTKQIKYSLYNHFFFILFQLVGWWELNRVGIYIAGKPDGSYLYLISGLHALHILGGMVFLIFYFYQFSRKSADPLDLVLLFQNTRGKVLLGNLVLYWHFVAGVWVFLLLFFFLNHLWQDACKVFIIM